MIKFTQRLDKAIKTAAWAHAQKPQYRKGSDMPYIIHPFGVMIIAGSVTDDEDILIACLLHDVLEDVDPKYYDQAKMLKDFGQQVVDIVLDVTKNSDIKDWHERSNDYLNHMENKACAEAVIVCAADKIHNMMSMITDYNEIGDELWSKFTTNSADDQLWWYESVLAVIRKRKVNSSLSNQLGELVLEIKELRKN